MQPGLARHGRLGVDDGRARVPGLAQAALLLEEGRGGLPPALAVAFAQEGAARCHQEGRGDGRLGRGRGEDLTPLGDRAVGGGLVVDGGVIEARGPRPPLVDDLGLGEGGGVLVLVVDEGHGEPQRSQPLENILLVVLLAVLARGRRPVASEDGPRRRGHAGGTALGLVHGPYARREGVAVALRKGGEGGGHDHLGDVAIGRSAAATSRFGCTRWAHYGLGMIHFHDDGRGRPHYCEERVEVEEQESAAAQWGIVGGVVER